MESSKCGAVTFVQRFGSALNLALIERRCRGLDSEEEGLSRYEPGLAALYAASLRGRIASGPNAGKRVGMLGDRIDGDSLEALTGPRCTSVDGFSVHGNVMIPARDRMRLERLPESFGMMFPA